MNSSSFLLCFVFAAIGYVLHPMLLPSLVSSKIVAESSLSDSYRDDDVKKSGKVMPESLDDHTNTGNSGDSVPKINDGPNTDKPKIPEIVVTPVPKVPDPVPPTPEPTPDPTPDPVPVKPKPEVVADNGVKLSEQALIDALKASVKAGDVKEFDIKQVIEWKQGDEEQQGGENYQVGMVTYKADTIFDEQELDAKALIKNGKVVKWLWPTTNTEMR